LNRFIDAFVFLLFITTVEWTDLKYPQQSCQCQVKCVFCKLKAGADALINLKDKLIALVGSPMTAYFVTYCLWLMYCLSLNVKGSLQRAESK